MGTATLRAPWHPSVGTPCSTLGRARMSCSFLCPQPRPPSVISRVASSPHQTCFIFISAQAAALLFGVCSQNLQIPGGTSAASNGDFVSLPSTPAPPPAHAAFHHLSHLVPICNKPGEGEDFGDPEERATWGSRIWSILKGLKKKKNLACKKISNFKPQANASHS